MPLVFDANGNKVFVSSEVPVNDLTQAPRFDEELPDNVMYSMIVIPSADGTPMIALVNPTLIATTEEVLQKIAAARQELVDAGIARDDALAAEVARINTMQLRMAQVDTNTATLVAQLAARKAVVPLPDVTVTQTATVALTAGERTFNVACPGIVKTTDTILLVNKNAYPTGYGLRGYSVPSDNNLSIVLQCPALILGGAFSIAFSVYAIR
jgi:hypothetical protein